MHNTIRPLKCLPIFLKLFHKRETKGNIPNSFYKATITPVPKPHEDPTRKGNFRIILFMNINSKVLSKDFKSKNTSKMIIQHNQVGFIPGM